MLEHAELLDYALGRLDDCGRARIDQQIARDPALAQRVAQLVRNLRRLLNDGRGGLPWEDHADHSPPLGGPVGQDCGDSLRPGHQRMPPSWSVELD